jgi:hypothetical protein
MPTVASLAAVKNPLAFARLVPAATVSPEYVYLSDVATNGEPLLPPAKMPTTLVPDAPW